MTWRTPHRASSARAVNIWPGFVDALSALLMVVIFVLMVFMVAQFYLSNVLTGREDLLGRLNDRIAELNAQVDLERQENADLRARFAELSDDLQITVSERDDLSDSMADLRGERDDLSSRLSSVLAANEDLLSEIDLLDTRLATASQTIDADRETIELQLRDIARLEADIRALTQTKDVLEAELASLGLALQASREEAEALGVSLADQTSLAALLRQDLATVEQDNLALSEILRDRELELGALLEEQARLQETLTGTEEALAQSDLSVEELTAAVTDQRQRLALRAAALTALEEALAAREATVAAQSQALSEQEQAIAALDGTVETLTGQLQLSGDEVIALRQLLDERGADLAALRARLDESQAAEVAVGEQVEALTLELRISEEDRTRILDELGALRDRSQILETQLSTAEERTVLMQAMIDDQDVQITDLAGALAASERTRTSDQEIAASQIDALTEQLDGLRGQILELQQALSDTESTVTDQDLEIASLTSRLNQALVQRVEELGRYRSEFFGRLRAVLGSRSDIRVVGDRFVFQSEVLFASGSATLQPSGADELGEFADTLLDLTSEFPPEVDWILRVDGHTDIRPISTAAFRSNWELSTARALEVVEFLEGRGIPPERLAAAGFGEFQPLDPRPTESAYQRNRRIELKLDQR